MGEVYRARDEKLGRDVALKVLPSGSLADEEARRRFRKEATVLARLSHPHIASLFDFDTADGTDFLVMELVVGPTLEEQLRRGPLPEKEVIRLGSQLARGLVAAHEQGVIHRDLKPSNLQLTSDGLLKILDFGVAHLERGPAAAASGEATATETAAGEVLGSPPYMAPEQLLGKSVDARTDLYAAGACLYELATGKRPYGDKRGPQLTEAILHEAPALPRGRGGPVSPGLQAVILKALDKDPGLRHQSAKDLLVDLERLNAAASTGAVASGRTSELRRRPRWPRAAAALAVLAVGLGAWWLRRPPPEPRITRIEPLTRGHTDATRVFIQTLISDGTRVFYVGVKDGETGLFQIPANGGESSQIPVPFRGPMVVLGYSRAESALLMGDDPGPGGWRLWMVPVTGGPPRRVGNLRSPATLSPDGRQLARFDSSTKRFVVVKPDGSDPRTIGAAPEVVDYAFRWSPDGRRLRWTARGPSGHESEGWIWETAIEGGTAQPVSAGMFGDWTADGRFFVTLCSTSLGSRSDLCAVREGRLGRVPQPEVTRLTFGPHWFSFVASSPDRRRLFAFGEERRAELLRWHSARQRFEPFLKGDSIGMVDASPDGQWLAWVSFPDGTLWRARRDGSERLQLTSDDSPTYLPRWSPDGTRIAFVKDAENSPGLEIRVVSIAGGESRTIVRPSAAREDYWDECWLPDGRTIVFSNLMDAEAPGIGRVDTETLRRDRLPHSEGLKYPKCGRQGQILASRVVPSGGKGDTNGWEVLWPGKDGWEPVSDLPPLVYPSWSRDGRFLYGLNLQTARVERFDLTRRKVDIVADASGLPLAIWVFIPWFGLDFDDTPMLMRDRGTRELYALDWEAP
jgi:hypothetical protein